MNVLPMVFAFLLILSFSAHSLMQHRIDTKIEEMSYSGAMNAVRLAGDDEVKERKEILDNVDKVKNEKPKGASKMGDPSKDPYEEPEVRTKIFESKRVKAAIVHSAGAKFNISPLIEKEVQVPYKVYYEIGAKMIKRLYGHAPFFSSVPDLEYKLLDLMIKQGKEHLPLTALTQLHEARGGLSDILYKMIIGTQEYDLEKKTGYPPLEHFFSLDSSKLKKPLYFYFASKVLLEEALGKEISDAVMAEEKKLWEKKLPRYILKQEEFKALIDQKFPGKVPNEVYELFNHGMHGPKENKTPQGKDEKTKIVHKRKAVSMQPEQMIENVSNGEPKKKQQKARK